MFAFLFSLVCFFIFFFREISFSLLHTPSDFARQKRNIFCSKRIEELGFSTRDEININLRNRERESLEFLARRDRRRAEVPGSLFWHNN